MNRNRWAFAGTLCALLSSQALEARPVLYARSTSFMVEYRGDAMAEAQVFYAPRHNYSFGLGHTELDDGGTGARHYITYARANLLLKRWNRESSQANIFIWGGAGRAYLGSSYVQPAQPGGPDSGHDHGGGTPGATPVYIPAVSDFAWNSGGQIDFETRRFYTAFRTDFQYSDVFWHRADTLQFGIAPYEHDANTLATWFIVSGRKYSGNMHEGSELALLLRFFKKRAWFEVGATTEGNLQALAMFSL